MAHFGDGVFDVGFRAHHQAAVLWILRIAHDDGDFPRRREAPQQVPDTAAHALGNFIERHGISLRTISYSSRLSARSETSSHSQVPSASGVKPTAISQCGAS